MSRWKLLAWKNSLIAATPLAPDESPPLSIGVIIISGSDGDLAGSGLWVVHQSLLAVETKTITTAGFTSHVRRPPLSRAEILEGCGERAGLNVAMNLFTPSLNQLVTKLGLSLDCVFRGGGHGG